MSGKNRTFFCDILYIKFFKVSHRSEPADHYMKICWISEKIIFKVFYPEDKKRQVHRESVFLFYRQNNSC